MDEQDDFAVWVADGLLKAQDDEIAAASLSGLYKMSADSAEFNRQLDEASSQIKRPGDFGLEFIGPLLPVLFVEFGRLLWQAYSKELLSHGRGDCLGLFPVCQLQVFPVAPPRFRREGRLRLVWPRRRGPVRLPIRTHSQPAGQ